MKIDYSNISNTYDDHRSFSHSEILKLISFGNLKDGMKILDLGCGTGNLSAGLSNCIKVDIIGIDKSFPMLKKAKAKALQIICADADYNLPFNDHSFDVVIGSYVIHHIKNRMSLIAECFRILCDGSLIFLTSSHDQIEQIHPVIKEFFPSLVDLDKKRFPEMSELESLFKAAGFKKIKHEELVISKIPIDMMYLEKVRNKFVSTFYLLSEKEFNKGIEKLEVFIKKNKEPIYRDWWGTMILGEK
ncbi:sam-dependent methyltransferase [hydrocarbon metagenome]|uniref:Sam-dependent methyltransferase n=1 Tax=hydrocarbon metagenome TaxID=938273 RepID=A0A0W8FQQ8_9ZZZZ